MSALPHSQETEPRSGQEARSEGRGLPARPNCRERFLAACQGRPVDRPPLWLMRQAGRALPEYRQLREKYSFLELVQTPELAAEVTLQPIRRFGFDAAILFSDILVVPEALGQGYSFPEGGGVRMEFALRGAGDLRRLAPGAIQERLQYVAQALGLLRPALGGRTALLGFSGAPWTLANFMLEGGSAREFRAARAWLESDPASLERLLDLLAEAITTYLRLQIDAGVDAVQIFDTLAGTLPDEEWVRVCAPRLRRIVDGLEGRVPAILFAKGINRSWSALTGTGARALSVDATVALAPLRARLPAEVALQGNLDPALLPGPPERVQAETRRLLGEMAGARGFIFNLGHGVPPDARLESLAVLAQTVQGSA